jgi:polyisoprenoid-binding protein YceI
MQSEIAKEVTKIETEFDKYKAKLKPSDLLVTSQYSLARMEGVDIEWLKSKQHQVIFMEGLANTAVIHC